MSLLLSWLVVGIVTAAGILAEVLTPPNGKRPRMDAESWLLTPAVLAGIVLLWPFAYGVALHSRRKKALARAQGQR